MSLLVQPNLVTTIIPVFNRPQMVIEAVQSVLGQSYRPIEIIIVDDGSNDETPTVLKSLESEHAEIRVFSQTNSGPGVARELGRLNARGEYIQYLDSDDLLLPEKFFLQVEALKSKPSADVAYGKTELIHIGGKPTFKALKGTGIEQKAMFPSMLRERWWSTSTPLFRRSVVDKAGPWTASTNEEDWENDCRIASFGGRLAYVNEFVSLTRMHGEHLSSQGATDIKKLRDRALSRAKIFNHAKSYMSLENRPTEILAEDWEFFSKYAFLLARQCALAGLTTEARAMTSISIEAVGKKTPRHFLFLKLVKLFGWQKAAKIVTKLGK